MRILRSFRIEESLDHELESYMKKHNVKRTEALHGYIQFLKNEKQKLSEKYEKLRREFRSRGLKVSPSEKEIVQKALGLDYPDDCYDWLPIDGDPIKRACICKPSERPVHIPKNKKTGKYIIDNPKVCWRCRALGYRKTKNISNKKTQQKPKLKKTFCKRDSKLIDFGNNNCLVCTWLPSECSVKRQMLKKLRT